MTTAGTSHAFENRGGGVWPRLPAITRALRMKDPAAALDKGRSLKTLDSTDAAMLSRFYLGLKFAERRARFGAAISDESIQRFCRAIDWGRVIAIGRVRNHCLEAVIEVHPLCASWDTAEIALASAMPAARTRIFAELLQIAAFAAGHRGCSTLTMLLNSEDRELLPLLAGMGNVVFMEDHASVDLGDYTLGRNVTASRQ
jgi:hypothetical protein